MKTEIKMEKITRNFEVKYYLGWLYAVEISKIKKDIEEIEKLGATHVEIDIEYDCGDPYVSVKALSKRLETDKDLQHRIEEEYKRRLREIEKDFAKLEEIKLKYNL